MSTGYLIGNWSRFYVVDEKNRSLAKRELTGSTQERVEKIQKMREGIIPSEIVEMVKEALKSVDVIAVEDGGLASGLDERMKGKIVISQGDTFRNLRLMFFRKGIYKERDTVLLTALYDKREADSKPDAVIHRLVDMLKTFDESYQFYENFKETWYKDRFVKSEEEAHSGEELIIKGTDDLLKVFSHLQKKTQKRLASICKGYAPNLCSVAGIEVAARLIAEAGSLKRLSVLSAGTIQLLGSKKRLTPARTRPPKFGIIFSHPLIQELPPEKRGKMARSLSCKIAIACRADQYTHQDISEELKAELERRFKELNELKVNQ